jgi:hypothetical protein
MTSWRRFDFNDDDTWPPFDEHTYQSGDVLVDVGDYGTMVGSVGVTTGAPEWYISTYDGVHVLNDVTYSPDRDGEIWWRPLPHRPQETEGAVTAGWEYREYAAFAKLCAALGNVAVDRPVAEVMEMAAETIDDHARSIGRAISTLLFPPYTAEERRRKALDHLGYRPPEGLERGDGQ